MVNKLLDRPEAASAQPEKTVLAYSDIQPGPKERTTASDNATRGMVFADSATRALTNKDVAGLDEKQTWLARNEIYARHGRPFATPELAAHFESQPWYQKNEQFKVTDLNSMEQRNVAFLNIAEFDHKWKGAGAAGKFEGQNYDGDTKGSVLPESSKRNLTDKDVANLSAEQLATARNEIYARKGMVFKSPSIQAQFDKMSWYKKNENFQESDLSPQEYRNALFIKLRESDLALNK